MINILFLLAAPDRPGKPEARDWSKHHADLKWAPPKHDGGAPITSYIVEKKDQYRLLEKTIEIENINAFDIN